MIVVIIAMVVVLWEGQTVGHVLRVNLGAFVAVVVMVVVVMVIVAVVVMVLVAVVVMVLVAVVVMALVAVVIVTVVVVMVVSAPHLQHDKVEGFDARGFEFEHVLAFFKAVDVNHGVRWASLGAVDGFLRRRVLVALVMVMLLMFFLVVMRLGDHGVVDVGRSPSDVLGLVQQHLIDADLADVPVVAGLVPDMEGPVPRGVGFNATDARDHVPKGWVQ